MRSYAGAQHRRKPTSAWLAVGLAIFSVVTGLADEAPSNGRQESLFRFGFSSGTFSDVNESDAKAAMKVWMQMLAKERGLRVDSDPIILNGVEAISQALRGKLIDALALPWMNTGNCARTWTRAFLSWGLNEGRITEDYVLLVHQDSEITANRVIFADAALCSGRIRE